MRVLYEARERLVTAIRQRQLMASALDRQLNDLLGDLLATTDNLAALVTWPALLAAGERAGKVAYESCETEAFYRLTDPEAAS